MAQLLGVFLVRSTFCTDDGSARLGWIVFTKKPTTCLVGVMAPWETGPKYIPALSGTKRHTGHLAHLTIKRSKEMEVTVREVEESNRLAYLVMGPSTTTPPTATPRPRPKWAHSDDDRRRDPRHVRVGL